MLILKKHTLLLTYITIVFKGLPISVQGDFLELDAPLEKINLHVRGGYVIPTQQPANSTVLR